LQGLQKVFDLKPGELSWATGGYMGAIESGQTTCGLLIGSSVALGLACGKGKTGSPEKNMTERQKAIGLVNELYKEFIEKFQATQCKLLLELDFSAEGFTRYIEEKIYEERCEMFLDFIMNRCIDMVEQEKL